MTTQIKVTIVNPNKVAVSGRFSQAWDAELKRLNPAYTTLTAGNQYTNVITSTYISINMPLKEVLWQNQTIRIVLMDTVATALVTQRLPSGSGTPALRTWNFRRWKMPGPLACMCATGTRLPGLPCLC